MSIFPRRLRTIVLLLGIIFGLSACAINPVTGKKELAFVPETTEISMGTEQYGPGRQMQGGDYTTHPEIVEYVRSVGQRLASVSDRALPYEFHVLNDGTPNAWALPGGKIAINRGLLTELESEAELAAVLAHEIVHSAARHGAKNMERGLVLQGAVLATSVATSNSEYAGLATGGAGMAAQLLTHKYSRSAELEADYYGMQYMARAGYDPHAAVELQRTFVRLSEGRQSNWLEGLFSTHPPSMERVEANMRTAAELNRGGETGKERYAQKMAPLLRDQDAYEKYAQGREALNAGHPDKALALAEEALALQPEEPLFHSLRGDIRLKQGRFKDAVTNFDRALALDDTYFHYYVQRGLAYEKLGNPQLAQADLQRSTKYLPTAPALNGLGQLALKQGAVSEAKEYFSAAASSDSAAGQAAKNALVRLDIKDNPHKYVRLGGGLDSRNYLRLQLSNATSVPIGDIVVEIRYVDSNANRRSSVLEINRVLPAEERIQINTRIGPLRSLDNIDAKVRAAAVAEGN